MKRLGFLITLLLIVVLTGWSTVGCTAGKSEAENIANSYFESVENKDFDKALTYYSPKFFEKTTAQEWTRSLQTINVKWGIFKHTS